MQTRASAHGETVFPCNRWVILVKWSFLPNSPLRALQQQWLTAPQRSMCWAFASVWQIRGAESCQSLWKCHILHGCCNFLCLCTSPTAAEFFQSSAGFYTYNLIQCYFSAWKYPVEFCLLRASCCIRRCSNMPETLRVFVMKQQVERAEK